MSSSLMWEIVRPAQARSLPDALKYALSPRYFDHDGSMGSDKVTLSDVDLPYLEGLKDGNVEGATELIEAIKKHEIIAIWTER